VSVKANKGKALPRWFGIVISIWLLTTIALLIVPDLILLAAIVFPIGIVWIAVPVYALVLSAFSFHRKRYRLASGLLLVPGICVLLVLDGRDWGERVWFELHRASYDKVVAQARAGRCNPSDWKQIDVAVDGIDCGPPITIVFPWSGFLSSWWGVVSDAGEQIVRAPKDRNETWKRREIGGLLSCSGGGRSFGSHYYRAGGSYTSGTNECD
jgi:hypothetical protein